LKKDDLCDVKLNIRISCKIWCGLRRYSLIHRPEINASYDRYLQTMLWNCWCLWRDPSQTSEITRTTILAKRGAISRKILLLLSIFDQAAQRKVPFHMTTLGRPNLNLILVSKQRYCIEKSVSTFLHFLLLAPEKNCFTFMACLWYLMDSKTSKYSLPACARIYSLTRISFFVYITYKKFRELAHLPLPSQRFMGL